MPHDYIAYNGPMVTTAAFGGVTTGTAIKTLLQVATPATRVFTVVAWGITFDGSAAATPIKCELLDTNVAATVTAHVAAGVQPYGHVGTPASLATLGTAATGYTATAEGSITASTYGDLQYVAPNGGYSYEFSLGREWVVGVSRFIRIRVTAGAAVNAVCWLRWSE
jgi:hypothetical protein